MSGQQPTPAGTPAPSSSSAAARRTTMTTTGDTPNGGNTFDGTGDYEAWKRGATVMALTADTPAAGAKAIFKLLRGSAVDTATASLGTAAPTTFPWATAATLLEVLDSTYGTSTAERQKEALRKIGRLRQGNKTLTEHLEQFNTLASQAQINAPQKISLLKATVSARLATPAALIDEDTIGGFMQKLKIADDMIPSPAPGQKRGWKKVEKTKARQVTASEDIRCYNCNKNGHIARKCPDKKKGRTVKTENDSEFEGELIESENE